MKVHRQAVSVLFFINGFLHANWASRLPEFQDLLAISNSQLGTLLFTMAVGALTAMPFTGWLSNSLGSASVTRLAGLLLCVTVAVLALSTNLVIESVIFFFIGIANGSMDVAMNEQAVLVERAYKKPIMSSFHAFWSIGMALGAGSGALFSKFEITLLHHLWSVVFFGLIVVLWATGKLIITDKTASSQGVSGFMLPTRAIVPLGLIAFCGMLAEGSIIDWSAIYMNKVIGESEAMGAIAFGAFSAAMMIGRITGDYLTNQIGKRNLLVFDALLSVAGMSIVILFASPLTTLVGFFLAGLGISTIVPIIYTTAGNSPGVTPSVGIAMASTIGYSGFFVGPPTIGYLADAYGLRFGLIFTLCLLVVMLLLILTRGFKQN